MPFPKIHDRNPSDRKLVSPCERRSNPNRRYNSFCQIRQEATGVLTYLWRTTSSALIGPGEAGQAGSQTPMIGGRF
jgi:hypothetical protein